MAARPPSLCPLTPVPGAGQEDQAELADLHLVTTGEDGLVDRLAVDVGAVQAADVDDDELATLASLETGGPISISPYVVHFGADWLGKLKMGLQCAALIAILFVRSLPPDASAFWEAVQIGLIYAMLLATALSGLQYLWRAALLLREP